MHNATDHINAAWDEIHATMQRLFSSDRFSSPLESDDEIRWERAEEMAHDKLQLLMDEADVPDYISVQEVFDALTDFLAGYAPGTGYA